MKIIYISIWAIFLVGLTLKFLNVVGGATFMSLGCLVLSIHSVIYFIKNSKTNVANCFLYLSISLVTVYLLFRLQFWANAQTVFLLTLMVTITTFVVFFLKKTKIHTPQILLLVYFIFFLGLSFTQSYKIYYFEHLNELFNKEAREYDYYSWDRYSWFLYIGGEQDKAIEVNKKAQDIVNTKLRDYPSSVVRKDSAEINLRQVLIRDNKW